MNNDFWNYFCEEMLKRATLLIQRIQKIANNLMVIINVVLRHLKKCYVSAK